MKFLKGLVCVLVLSFCVPMMAKAVDYFISFDQISIPRKLLAAPYITSGYNKVNEYAQSLETYYYSDAAEAMVYGVLGNTSSTGWVEVSPNSVQVFDSSTAILNQQYKLELRSTSNIFGASYSGNWRINLPSNI